MVPLGPRLDQPCFERREADVGEAPEERHQLARITGGVERDARRELVPPPPTTAAPRRRRTATRGSRDGATLVA
jgi:hypothetical protein